MSAKSYIPHIDGMRAISVLAVIFFHFEMFGFTGGFIGVDVFFTISGYLIIGSIVGQAEAGKFKASSFWGRRIRRLFPAIFAVLFLSFLAGVLLMSPGDLTKLSKDALYGLVSLINFTLLGETDYFDLQGFNEPLLHFWSLAVEEQFYLVFPLIALAILACVKNKGNYKRIVIYVLLALSLLSLIAAEIAIRTGHPLVGYYMMPTRFFQLALGGVLAILLQSETFKASRAEKPKWLHDLLVISAIATIIGLSFIFTKRTPFPGINAIWPTLAAIALLYSGGFSRLSPLLENSIASHIGKLSYSLYLVHWPVWTFMCYYFDRLLTWHETLVALLLTYIISWIIYKFVETPVRFSKTFEGRRLYPIVGTAAGASAVLFFATINWNGWTQRIPENQRAFATDANEFHRTNFGGVGYARGQVVKLGHPLAEPEFILIGDSKARQFAYGLDQELLKRNKSAEMIAQDGCYFILGAGRIINGKRDENCQRVSRLVDEHLNVNNLPVIASRSWNFLHTGNFEHYYFGGANDGIPVPTNEMNALTLEVAERFGQGGRKLFLVGSNRFFKQSTTIADCLARPVLLGLPCLKDAQTPISEYTPPEIEERLKSYSAENEMITFLDATSVYCPEGICYSVDPKGVIIHSDPGHLSKEGSKKVGKGLLEITGLAQGQGPSLGDIRSTDDILSTLKAAAQRGDRAAIESEITELLSFVDNDRVYFRLVNELWNGLDGVEKDRETARIIAERVSDERDESLSTYVAGFAYWWGETVDKDFGKAVKYWSRPSQNANGAVQFRLAEIYLDSESSHFDAEEAKRLMKISAETGYQPAIDWVAAN